MPDGDVDSQYGIRFFSTDPRLPKIPSTEVSVPVNLDSDGLNEILAVQLDEEEEFQNNVSFLINDKLLSTSLFEFVTSNELSTEGVIEVECFLAESAPKPEKSINVEDWVADVKVNDKWIIAATYDGELSIFSHKGNKLHSTKITDDSLRCLQCFTHNGEEYVITGGSGQTLTLHTIEKKDLTATIAFRGHERSIEAVTVNKNGDKIISGGFDKCLKIWGMEASETDYVKHNEENGVKAKKKKKELITRVPITTIEAHKDAVSAAQWNPINQGQLVSASWDQSLCLWDVETTEQVNRLTSNKAFQALSVQESNGLIVTASMDSTIRLWDFRSQEGGMVKKVFRGHFNVVSDVSWSQLNPNLFVSAGFDETVKLWDIRSTDASLFDISGHKGHVLSVDWSNDELIASGGKDSSIKTYRRS
ncbi:unnamed protein product [Bursaphelenchus xylophilus]|uniref:(pine wood nematode) hypothetical protein n=1 Tax=Bursaphelenchus xylophilus TaxID=6326 RepID=A0A1I7RVQ1_BURXY|nr:unnamed protein product [Bursaphelenchus xylophilus]CAG9081992.1 unnamed protein product [Bursaphelenchus xylophilus]